MTWRILFKGLLMLASLARLGFIASHFQFGDMLSQHWIDNEVRGKGWAGDLLLLAVGALAGSGVNLYAALRLTLAVVLFVIFSLIGVWLYRRHRHNLAGVNDEPAQPGAP